jgi:hypothetical protein
LEAGRSVKTNLNKRLLCTMAALSLSSGYHRTHTVMGETQAPCSIDQYAEFIKNSGNAYKVKKIQVTSPTSSVPVPSNLFRLKKGGYRDAFRQQSQ